MDTALDRKEASAGESRNRVRPVPADLHRASLCLGPKKVGAGEFLTALFGPYYGSGRHGFIEIRVIGERGVRSYFFRGLASFGRKRFESKTCHTYYGLLPRERKEGRKEAVEWALALWTDLDGKNFTGGKEEAWARLRTFPLPPSVILDSGHGLQALWLLREPERVEESGLIEGSLAGLAKALNGDPAVCELARIFRLPGSFNVKDPKNPIEVKVKFFNPRGRYQLSDFESFRIALPKTSGDSEASGIEAEKQEGLEKVLACKFIRYAETHARELPEPLWWSALTNLLSFKGGHEMAHELSKPYEKGRNRYSSKETERKIAHILRTSPGPHTCRKIVQHGYPCSFVGTCPVESPAGLAWAEDDFVGDLRKESFEIKGGVTS